MAPLKTFVIGALFAATAGHAASDRPTPEDKLQKALAGRVAGKPVNCIYQHDIDSTEIFDRTAILYKMNNGTYYLNRPASGAQSLDWNAILVTDTHSSQLCNVDIVKLIDSGSRFFRGTVGLSQFVPYAKQSAAK